MTFGLTVRWPLLGQPTGTDEALRRLVPDAVAALTGTAGLHSAVWQLSRGFVAVVTLWDREDARARHLADFRANPSPVTQLLGTDPEVVQEWEVVGIAAGAAGPLV